MRLFIIANIQKAAVQTALTQLLPWLKERVQLAGVDTDKSTDLSKIEADAILILGGDGTLLSAARRLGARQIPLMGINFGRLGFLSSFTPDGFKAEFEALLANGLPARKRLMIETSVVPAGIHCNLGDPDEVTKARQFVATALNDAVITAGAPFHMIELEIGTNNEAGVRYFGDGIIISTPSGSTAYNVSAGGPIINPDVECLCITPVCPHSVSFRPVVVDAASNVLITAFRVNEGTTVFCDGQASTRLGPQDRVIVRRALQDALLIENPRASGWRALAEKLNWATTPKYNQLG